MLYSLFFDYPSDLFIKLIKFLCSLLTLIHSCCLAVMQKNIYTILLCINIPTFIILLFYLIFIQLKNHGRKDFLMKTILWYNIYKLRYQKVYCISDISSIGKYVGFKKNVTQFDNLRDRRRLSACMYAYYYFRSKIWWRLITYVHYVLHAKRYTKYFER